MSKHTLHWRKNAIRRGLFGELFPPFPGIYPRGGSQQMGKTTSPNVCLRESVCPASRAGQSTRRNSARRWPSIFPNQKILTSPSCGYFLTLWSVWIVAQRNLLFRKKRCANSQRETLPRQVNLQLSFNFSPRINS